MAVPGLSLYAFYDQQAGRNYLTGKCEVAFRNPADAHVRYNIARNRLRPKDVYPDAGSPVIADDLGRHGAHLAAVLAHPTLAWAVAGAKSFSFCSVEIAPLVAFQSEVFSEFATAKVAGIGTQSPIDDLLSMCLPTTVDQVSVQPITLSDGSPALLSQDMNIRVCGRLPAGAPDPYTFGLDLRISPAFVVVARIAGDKCYLKNGYHRAYGLASVGRPTMPCIIVDYDSYDQIGVERGHFPKHIVLSKTPPTLGYFLSGRASSVMLRRFGRIITAAGDLIPAELP